MLGILYFIVSILNGFFLAKYIFRNISPKIQLICIAPLGILASSVLTLLLVLIFGYEIGLYLFILCSLLSVIIRHKDIANFFKYIFELKLQFSKIGALLAVCLVSFIIYIEYTKSMLSTATGYIAGGYLWGDISLHSTLINHFAQEQRFDFNNPILSDSLLSYPFIYDFYSGILRRLGLSLHLSQFLPNTLLFISLIAIVYLIASNLFSSRKAGALSLFLFMFTGSLKGAIHFTLNIFSQGISYITKQNEFSHLSSVTEDSYLNFVFSHLLPQRQILLAMPIVLIALLCILVLDKRDISLKQGAVLTVVTGLLPFVHAHSFMIVLGLLILKAVFDIVHKEFEVDQLKLLILFIVSSLPFLVFQFINSETGSFFSISMNGWQYSSSSAASSKNILVFWLENIGIYLPLLFTAPYLVRKNSKLLYISIAALSIFILANFIQFQPNGWDNMKLFNYSFYFISLILVSILASKYRKNILHKSAAVTAIFSLTFMGVLTTYTESIKDWTVSSVYEIELAEKLRKIIPEDSVVLAKDRHNHPIPVLLGRSMYIGYKGWIWTHGLDYSAQEKVISLVNSSSDLNELLSNNEIDYIALTLAEMDELNINKLSLDSNLKQIFTDEQYYVYEVNN